MWINDLTVQNCRSISKASLQLSPQLNIITGKNASGKTSLLEAIYLLSSGRSFQTSHITDVIRHKQKSILVTASMCFEDAVSSHIGIEKSLKKTRIRINKENINSQAELSRVLPITIIHPDSIRLISGAPSYRRAYIDWIAFYLYPEFYPKWKSYQRILKQRNLCLKDHKHLYSLEKWTEELVSLQPDITDFRMRAIKKLEPIIKNSASKLLKNKQIDLEFQSGFPPNINLEFDSLIRFYSDKKNYDLATKRTSYGAHKANIKFLIDSKPAERTASRGQLKLLCVALLLSQSKTIQNIEGKVDNKGILLFDDFTSELDSNNEISLIEYLFTLNQQTILTTTDSELMGKDFKAKMFHVKHGDICEL